MLTYRVTVVKFRGVGVSRLTAAVQVSYFLKAQLLKNIGEPFRILPRKKNSFLARGASKSKITLKGDLC